MKNVDRPIYMDRIKPFIGNDDAKIIMGIRRCGKSTLMRTLSESMDPDVNKIYINMELLENHGLRDMNRFHDAVKEMTRDGMNCLFVDEIQDVIQWESAIRSLIAEGGYDIYLTGSNSKLLSSEYTTYLGGRVNTLNMNPLTYRECIDFETERTGSADNDKVFQRYLDVGGFPALWRNEYPMENAYSMLRDIRSVIMLKDIIDRYGVREPDLLDRIFMFLCDNIGKYTSVNNMYTTLHNTDRGTNRDTVYQYVGYLEDAYIIQKAKVFDIRGKRILSTKYKYFLADLGLKHSAMGHRPRDVPGHMENILFTEMRSRGYDVWVGDSDGKEIDIVAEKFGERVYIQAVFQLTDEIIGREFGNLETINDNHPKYVVTMHPSNMNGKQDGIVCCPMQEFLMKDSF